MMKFLKVLSLASVCVFGTFPAIAKLSISAPKMLILANTPVESSSIKTIGFKSGVLQIVFNGGNAYQYLNVPEDVYEELMESKSKGKFFSQNIRGKYKVIRIY